jgi:hypothetical protein
VITHAGYILGFPADTPESIERDIRVLQQELPIDILEFFVMTPLPGSADHKEMYERGVWMDPDMNKYDSEHVTTGHPRMTAGQWLDIYQRAWHLYYSPEHVETLMRRAEATGLKANRLLSSIMLYYGTYRHEGLHPLQCGILRRRVRTTRRPTFRRESPLVFYPRLLWQTARTWFAAGRYYLEIRRVCNQVRRDPAAAEYTDLSLTPVKPEELAVVAADEGCESCEPAPAVVPLAPLIAPAKRAA